MGIKSNFQPPLAGGCVLDLEPVIYVTLIYSVIHKAAGLPAAVQNGLQRPFLPLSPIHSLWDIFQWNGGIVPVKPKEWPGTMRLVALWITLLTANSAIHKNRIAYHQQEIQGSQSTWKTWKNESTPGKPGNIMEFWKI